MRPKVILNLLFFLFCCTAVQAQTGRQITGKVIDAMGELPGVSVVIKGTTNGTTTDLNGEFKLDNVKNGDVLQFSFIGYKTENVKVGNQSKFDITMTENTQTLEEVTVVAVGYGDVRRRDLTGSIGSANMGDLTKTPVSNLPLSTVMRWKLSARKSSGTAAGDSAVNVFFVRPAMSRSVTVTGESNPCICRIPSGVMYICCLSATSSIEVDIPAVVTNMSFEMLPT